MAGTWIAIEHRTRLWVESAWSAADLEELADQLDGLVVEELLAAEKVEPSNIVGIEERGVRVTQCDLSKPPSQRYICVEQRPEKPETPVPTGEGRVTL